MEISMKIILILFLFCFSGCASLFQERTFVREMDKQSDGTWIPHEDFHVVPGDERDGYRSREEIAARTPESRKNNSFNDNLERELNMKEKLLTMEQYAEYSELKPDLETTSEKIYFISLSVDEREDYLSARQIGKYARRMKPKNIRRGYRAPASSSVSNSFRKPRDIYQGMEMDQVRSSWGRPSRVEVAGDPGNQNERWTFFKNGKVEQVFFEGGVVQGWALE
jgi:hypothetical protein